MVVSTKKRIELVWFSLFALDRMATICYWTNCNQIIYFEYKNKCIFSLDQMSNDEICFLWKTKKKQISIKKMKNKSKMCIRIGAVKFEYRMNAKRIRCKITIGNTRHIWTAFCLSQPFWFECYSNDLVGLRREHGITSV